MNPRRRCRGARPAIAVLLASLALAAGASGPASGAESVAESAADPGGTEADTRQALRLVEYEALLGEPLGLTDALCIDDQLERRWPQADTPSRPQWERMQEQARQAREQCASPAAAGEGNPDRAAGTIRRAMALQVERQRALAALQARLRGCLAAAPDSAECRALRRLEAMSPAQRARVQAAYEQGRR